MRERGRYTGVVNRIDQIFADLRAQGRRALMPFICGGHPGPGMTANLLPALEAAGASVVEIGIPFSDPIADGPVIAAAMHEALGRGATPRSVLDEVASVRDRVSLGLVAMVSVSIAYRLGGPQGDFGKFIADARTAGFDGLIFPDAPLEEAGALVDAARREGLTASLLIAPTTPPERMKRIAEASSGFVYLLARTGITGERSESPEVAARVARLRGWTGLPIACGFGISTPEQVRAVVRDADAAIVGSALVRRVGEAASRGGDAVGAGTAFVGELAGGLRGA